MLLAEQLELITAAVDGELSATEVRAFRRLLAASAEAREFHAKLKADSDRLRALPRAAAPADLRSKVLARLAASLPAPRVQPAFCPDRPARRKLAALAPIAVAAGVLLCISAGSFAYFSTQSPQNATAKHQWSNSLPAIQDAPAVPSPTAPAPRHLTRPDPDSVVRSDVSPVPPLSLPTPVAPESIAIAPEPRPARSNLIASRILPPLPPFDFVEARVPFLRAVAELDRDDIRQELTDALARDPARLDLFVRDTARGVEVFQNAARAAKLTLFEDAATLDKLKKRQVAAVVIYTESLTAEELTALFEQVCAADMKFTPRVCDSLHAMPIVRSDELELKHILGTDVGLFKRATGSGGTGQGGDRAEKPVSASTIDSVTKTLTSPSAKPGGHTAVLLTWQTAHSQIGRTPPAASAELKQFLANRGTRKPNAVPVVIVIRPVG